MLRSLARIAAYLDIDRAANRLIEGRYRNGFDTTHRLSRRYQVLMYHKVSPDQHPFFQPVQPDLFEQQMQFLSRCYRVMPLLELVERSRRLDLPDRAVAITFDDGYRDNYDYAFPILKKYGLPATIFVATGSIDTGEVLWHDRIFDSFRYATAEQASLQRWDILPLPLSALEDRQRSLNAVLRIAKQLYGETRLRFVEDVEAALKPRSADSQAERMLSWAQIREMHTAGIEFGSHTVTHPVLSKIPVDAARKELLTSKRELADQIGAPVSSFAYPNGHYGDYDKVVKNILKECGYACAVTAEWGFNDAFSDPFEIKRGQPSHPEIELFRIAFFLQRHGLN